MVLETILALSSLPISIATTEGIRIHRETEESKEKAVKDDHARLADFHLDVFCSSSSRKRGEVHGTMVVLLDGKVRL
jgi:hypothetical protein